MGLIWDKWDEGTNVRELNGHSMVVYDGAFSQDGEYAITGSEDGKAIVWELRNPPNPPIPRVRLSLVTVNIRGVAFSPDGNFIATASYDGLGRLWEWRLWEKIDNQKQEERPQPTVLRALTGKPGDDPALVICIAFSPNGEFVVTGYDDGTARVWATEKLDRKTLDELSADDILKLAKGRVTRELTPEEIARYYEDQ